MSHLSDSILSLQRSLPRQSGLQKLAVLNSRIAGVGNVGAIARGCGRRAARVSRPDFSPGVTSLLSLNKEASNNNNKSFTFVLLTSLYIALKHHAIILSAARLSDY